MNKIYRNRKGQYITRETHERTVLRRAYVFLGAILFATAFGVVSTYMRGEKTEASNMMTDEQLCSLHAIECDPEWAPLEVYEITDVPPEITASEVALWYLDSINNLLRAKGEEEYLPILEEQQIYARSVILIEHNK